jgi:hypothetical protein
MTPSRAPLVLACTGIALVAGIATLGWALEPERAHGWALIAGMPAVLWAFVELAQYRGDDRVKGAALMNWHRRTIAGICLFLAIRAVSGIAYRAGVMDLDARIVAWRLSGVLFGVLCVVWGNYLPKLVSPWRSGEEPFDWQGVHQFAGRVAMLAGAAVIACWMALPVHTAGRASRLILLPLAVLLVGRKLISLATKGGPPRMGTASGHLNGGHTS